MNEVFDGCWRMFCVLARSEQLNDLTTGWQKLNLLSHPIATLAPQVRQSGEILNYSQPNDHTLGYQTSNSASSSKFHYFALLFLLVALLSHSSKFHHLALLAMLVLH